MNLQHLNKTAVHIAAVDAVPARVMRGTGVRGDFFQQAQELVSVALGDFGGGKIRQRIDVDRFHAHPARVSRVGWLQGQGKLSQWPGGQAGNRHSPQFQGIAAAEGGHSPILSESAGEALKKLDLFFYLVR
jgi:hypothetical protein